VTDQRSFPNAPESVTQARYFTREALAGVDPEVVDNVLVMVSELATNSVRHAASAFTVTVSLERDQLRVAVTDTGTGRPSLRTPPSTEPSGRGLQVVRAFADAWGITDRARGPGKTVWFTVSVRPKSPDASHTPAAAGRAERAADERSGRDAGGASAASRRTSPTKPEPFTARDHRRASAPPRAREAGPFATASSPTRSCRGRRAPRPTCRQASRRS
jgi:anti-sigma regulatory factor (Ser/Thr protein kinase)